MRFAALLVGMPPLLARGPRRTNPWVLTSVEVFLCARHGARAHFTPSISFARPTPAENPGHLYRLDQWTDLKGIFQASPTMRAHAPQAKRSRSRTGRPRLLDITRDANDRVRTSMSLRPSASGSARPERFHRGPGESEPRCCQPRTHESSATSASPLSR